MDRSRVSRFVEAAAGAFAVAIGIAAAVLVLVAVVVGLAVIGDLIAQGVR
jgi:hypothetical protein